MCFLHHVKIIIEKLVLIMNFLILVLNVIMDFTLQALMTVQYVPVIVKIVQINVMSVILDFILLIIIYVSNVLQTVKVVNLPQLIIHNCRYNIVNLAKLITL